MDVYEAPLELCELHPQLHNCAGPVPPLFLWELLECELRFAEGSPTFLVVPRVECPLGGVPLLGDRRVPGGRAPRSCDCSWEFDVVEGGVLTPPFPLTTTHKYWV